MSENGEIYTAGNKFYTPAGTDRMDKFHLCKELGTNHFINLEGVKTGSIGEKRSFAIDGKVGPWHREDCSGILTFQKLFQNRK